MAAPRNARSLSRSGSDCLRGTPVGAASTSVWLFISRRVDWHRRRGRPGAAVGHCRRLVVGQCAAAITIVSIRSRIDDRAPEARVSGACGCVLAPRGMAVRSLVFLQAAPERNR